MVCSLLLSSGEDAIDGPKGVNFREWTNSDSQKSLQASGARRLMIGDGQCLLFATLCRTLDSECGAGSPASPAVNQECSLSHRLAEIVLVGLRMDQKTQVDVPQEQFLEAKLRKAFDEVSYSFEKILGEVRGDSNLVLAKQAVNQLQISLNQFENLLKEGGVTVGSCHSIKYLYQEIEHPLSELRRYFMKEPSEILTDKAGVVYVNALKASFRRLMDIAEEMDEGHSSIPKSAL
jgi:hypothetical protein